MRFRSDIILLLPDNQNFHMNSLKTDHKMYFYYDRFIAMNDLEITRNLKEFKI